MARINYSFVEFHGPFFLKGKNFPSKVKESADTKLWYDTELGFMCMEYKGSVTHFDSFHSADIKDPNSKSVDVKPSLAASEHFTQENKTSRGRKKTIDPEDQN